MNAAVAMLKAMRPRYCPTLLELAQRLDRRHTKIRRFVRLFMKRNALLDDLVVTRTPGLPDFYYRRVTE